MARGVIVSFNRQTTEWLFKFNYGAPKYIVRTIFLARRRGIISYEEFQAVLTAGYELEKIWQSRLEDMRMSKQSKKEM
jgi:hypothetical protein